MEELSWLNEKAIKAALVSDWEEAIKLNLEILKIDKESIEALCRLARAYLEKGELKSAKKTYQKVLKLDRFNPIAKRNLEKIKENVSVPLINKQKKQITNGLFLEEPGKTITVKLVRLASPKILLCQNVADEVNLNLKKRFIMVSDDKKNYLGRLPDDLSRRLIQLISLGNRYISVIKSVGKNNLEIFIKEVKRSKRNKNTPSFPISPDQYNSFLPSEVIDRPSLQMNSYPEES